MYIIFFLRVRVHDSCRWEHSSRQSTMVLEQCLRAYNWSTSIGQRELEMTSALQSQIPPTMTHKAIQLPIKQYLLLFPREFSHSGGWEFQYISVLAAIPTMATAFPQVNRLSRKEYSRPHLFCGEKNVVKENEVRCSSPIQLSKTDPCTLALFNHTQDKVGVPWMHHYMWLSQKALD